MVVSKIKRCKEQCGGYVLFRSHHSTALMAAPDLFQHLFLDRFKACFLIECQKLPDYLLQGLVVISVIISHIS